MNQETKLQKLLFINELTFLSLKQKIYLAESIIPLSEFASLTIDGFSLLLRTNFKVRKFNPQEILRKVKNAVFLIEKLGIKHSVFTDDDFPPLLREMSDPPFIIFYRGNFDLLRKNSVSVVGTRRATRNALSKANEFAKKACDSGYNVVSGLAFGIDLASHKGALDSQTPFTTAVLPSGIDTIAPSSNIKVAARILENGGLILSEYTPGTPALGFRCVQRDRIIAALSEATVVVQCPSGSGALITAKCALDYGREVLFHKAALEEDSQMLETASRKQIEKEIALGKNWSYKLDNTLSKFLEDGAPVIENFDDYLKFKSSAPGTFSTGIFSAGTFSKDAVLPLDLDFQE